MPNDNPDVPLFWHGILRQYLEIDILEFIVVPGTNGRCRFNHGRGFNQTCVVMPLVAERHRLSDSDPPFRRRLNYAVLSSVLAALLFAASSAAQARIINAASPSLDDVRRAIASAVQGDTVIVPAGTASWTSGITVTKGITIQGQTTTNSDNGTASDQTVLVDNLVQVPGGQGFFACTTNAGQSLRITGITFSGVGGRNDTMYNGAIRLGGTSDQVRVDHCHFISLNHQPNIQVNVPGGVSDHNVFDNLVFQCQSHRFFNGTGNGDPEFAQTASYGSSRFFFVEDCYINNTRGSFSNDGGMDAGYGGKFVVRQCHLFNVLILCHGTELDRSRGGRAQEIYNNDYHWSYLTTMDGIRSASLLVHDNTFDGVLPLGFGLQTYRTFFRYPYPGSPWLGASGDNPWDVNVTEPDGTHIDGHPPYLFESGTATGGREDLDSGHQYLTDTSKNWTPNRWVGYTARRVSDSWIGRILSNNNNTLTMYYYNGGVGQGITWRSGDQYQIHKVLIALDQPGRGRGDLITGNPPINSTTGNAAWPHQELEPCYSWNNIHSPGGEHINFTPAGSSSATLLQGRDYFNNTPMPGYTPYTYPHPLTTGVQPAASATLGSPQQAQKKKKKWGKAKSGWGKAKKIPANEMAQPEQ